MENRGLDAEPPLPETAEPLDDEKGPERTCIVTRAKGDPQGMIRFVVDPAGAVVPDLRGRLPGRGAWVVAGAGTVAAAVKRRAFARAFRREVVVDASLAERVDALLAADALATLSLANKAGLVVAGAFKVEDALGRGTVAALLHAVDGSPDSLRKLEGLARRAGAVRGTPVPMLQIFASPQLDLALGRSNVINAALLVGGASDAVLKRIERLRLYRGAEAPRETGREPDPATITS